MMTMSRRDLLASLGALLALTFGLSAPAADDKGGEKPACCADGKCNKDCCAQCKAGTCCNKDGQCTKGCCEAKACCTDGKCNKDCCAACKEGNCCNKDGKCTKECCKPKKAAACCEHGGA
jgi:hypothetical protein